MEQMTLLMLGAVLFVVAPLAVAIVWTVRKKERFSTVLVGALTFLVFAVVLEKLLQNLLIFPTYLGLADHAASRFINSRPVLWAVLLGLFPGVFEETGRLVAFKTLLRRRKNRETAISYGLGHGGFEVMFVVGITYIIYIITSRPASFSAAELLISVVERIFALLFHIGASILVFYACRDRKYGLYVLAILLHTAMDAVVGFNMAGLVKLSVLEIEAIIGLIAILVFFGSYFLLYHRKI